MDESATLARAITWSGSKQTYYTARLVVDRDLVDDFFRAYAYFRWADDVVDESAQSAEERISFIERQCELAERLYQGERPAGLLPEEGIVADLIGNDDRNNHGLRSFITKFLAVIDFDARRKGRLISREQLAWYSDCLGEAVTDGIQYFIAHDQPHVTGDTRYLGATAAHIAHMLRDMVHDVPEGYVNVPGEYLAEHGIGPDEFDSPAMRAWVEARVDLAWEYFRDGKLCLDEVKDVRRRVAAHWYAARYQGVLDAIERDGYALRAEYAERRSPAAWLRMGWLGAGVLMGRSTSMPTRFADED